MSIERNKDAEREAQIMPYEDYLMIEYDDKDKCYSVKFARSRISRESAIRQYRAILEALYNIEQNDIKQGII